MLRNEFFKLDYIEYYDGATFLVRNSSKNDGITLGSYINIKSKENKPMTDNKFDPSQNQLFMHEYGHYLQSQGYGWAYLFNIGIPSIISAATSKVIDRYVPELGCYFTTTTHKMKWYERGASRQGYYYFKKKNETLTWDENLYPL